MAAAQRRNRAGVIAFDASAVSRAGFLRAGFSDPGLVLRWKEIVGAEVARIARPLKLVDESRGGVLTLRADPAAALFLQHESRALCARINAWLGRPAVQRLRFVPGDIASEPERPPRRFEPEPSPDDPATRFSGDGRLASALLRLARSRSS